MKQAVIAIFHGLGDCVNATALLKPLKTAYPNCEITWITSEAYASLVKNNPYITKTETIKGNVWEADSQYKNLRKKHGKNLITPAPYLNGLSTDKTLLGSYKDIISKTTKIKNQPLEPVLFQTAEEKLAVTEWLKTNGIDKYIMLEALFTSSQSFWNRDHTDIVLKMCAEKGLTVLMTHRSDTNLDQYNKICKTYCLDFGFRSIPGFYNKSSGFIGVSSGISCITHTHECSKNIPHLEFVRGEHWCTRNYRKNKKVISFKDDKSLLRRLIQDTIQCT